MKCKWTGVVGTVGKISAFQPQGPQFNSWLTKIWTDLRDFVSCLKLTGSYPAMD